MIVRIFRKLESGVINVRIHTEDWSELEKKTMVKIGEPKINLGGRIFPVYGSSDTQKGASDPASFGESDPSAPVVLDDIYVRVMTESPFTHKFDLRDYGMERAYGLANGWADTVIERIRIAVEDLRDFDGNITTEEVVEI